MLKQYRTWQSGEILRLGEYYDRQGFVFSQDNGSPILINHLISHNCSYCKVFEGYLTLFFHPLTTGQYDPHEELQRDLLLEKLHKYNI